MHAPSRPDRSGGLPSRSLPDLARGAWAKLRGEAFPGIPCTTYNLHPFGRHGSEPSYGPLLDQLNGKAAMLIKHEPARSSPDPRSLETEVCQSAAGTRHTLTWHTPQGPLRSTSVTPPGQPAYVVEPFIKSDADVDRVLSTPPTRVRFDLAATRQALDAATGRGILYVSYPDPMYSAAALFDSADFAIRCATDPDRVQALIDHQAEAAASYVDALAAACAGLPLLFYTAGPELATPPLLPPAAFRRFVTPYQQRLIRSFHRYGHCVAIHCHGRVRQVLDEVLDTGADVLEPIEPPPQGDIGLRELLDRVRGRLCLMGYIQDQDFYRGEAGLMRRRVAEIASLVGPTERYIMAPTCTPFQFPAAAHYLRAYGEWLDAAAELLPSPLRGTA